MPSAKENQLTQAIIDKNDNEVDILLKTRDVQQWISNRVLKSALLNHGLRVLEWTTAMCRSCRFSGVATVKKLVCAGASLYDINSNGHTALHMACSTDTDRMEKIKYLVKEDGKLIHATNTKGASALHAASENGDADVCEYLLNAGARVNAADDDGVTSLHLAAKNNSVAVINILHRHGANMRSRSTRFNEEPLHLAASNKSCAALEALIGLGADIHALGFKKRSALHDAAQYDSIECIKDLVDRGVPVDTRDAENVTPLHMAANCDHAQCIHALVSVYGANINAQTIYGNTPLHHACRLGQRSAVEALTSHPNCDINIKNKDGKTASELAASKNHQHIVSRLSQQHTTSKPLDGVHQEPGSHQEVACSKPIEQVQRELSEMKREMKALKEQNAAAQSIGAMSISDDSKQSEKELKKSIRRNMHWLVENIPAMPHVDFLYSHEALNEEDYQNISAVRTEAGKVRMMIMTLMEKPNVSWAPIFLESLREKSDFAVEKILAK